MNKKVAGRLFAFLLLLIYLLSAGIKTKAMAEEQAAVDFTAFNGKRIGVQVGTTSGQQVEDNIPDAVLSYYNNQTDILAALRAGKIDAWCADESILKFMQMENDDLMLVNGYLDTFEYAPIFAKNEKGEALCEEYSAFVNELWDKGVIQELDDIWYGKDEARRTVLDYEALPDTNGTLHMAVDTSMLPFAYVKDNRVVGFDVDMAARFCEANGYRLIVEPMDFGGILAAVQSGKVDFAACAITITEERKESVLFSSPNYRTGAVLVTLRPEKNSEGGLKDSFDRTFVREGRWKLFLEGILTTMLITLLSILFGTLLGFIVFMLCRDGNMIANNVTRFCIFLVQGTPMVVLLMILYYIIFASVSVNGAAVAIIGFTLTFGASVFGLLKMGVGTIERGQYEAAYALGHNSSHTFFKIILPQAIFRVLPAYQSEIVSLIKATAIVGYIAVQDLTKMGDIVRSRTYEAFFPLIAITVIYFVLEGLFGFAVSRIRINIDPRKRKREQILKGINIHDKD